MLLELFPSAIAGVVTGVMFYLVSVKCDYIYESDLACCPSEEDILKIASQGNCRSAAQASKLTELRRRLVAANSAYENAKSAAEKVSSNPLHYLVMLTVGIVSVFSARAIGMRVLNGVVFAAFLALGCFLAHKKCADPAVMRFIGKMQPRCEVEHLLWDSREDAAALLSFCERELDRVSRPMTVAIECMEKDTKRAKDAFFLYLGAAFVYICVMLGLG